MIAVIRVTASMYRQQIQAGPLFTIITFWIDVIEETNKTEIIDSKSSPLT